MHFFLPFSCIFLESRVHIEVVYIVYMQRWSLLDFLLYGVQIEGMSVMIREREKKKKERSRWWENLTDESAAVGGDKRKKLLQLNYYIYLIFYST